MTRALVSHEHKFVWVAVAKAASMVMHTVIVQRLGLSFHEWHRSAVGSLAEVQRMSDYFRFGFVRNPWARLYSCYRDKILGPVLRNEQFILGAHGMRPGMPFDEFLRRVAEIDDAHADGHFVSQFYSLSHERTLVVDYVGRFENLPADWDRLREPFDLPELPWSPVGTLRTRYDFDYHKPHYTPELIELVRRRFADDIECFGYDNGPEVPP